MAASPRCPNCGEAMKAVPRVVTGDMSEQQATDLDKMESWICKDCNLGINRPKPLE